MELKENTQFSNTMANQTPLSIFTNQLVAFFEELTQVFPEEKDVKMGLEAIRGAKKVNPRLILDLFYEHVWRDLAEAVKREDLAFIQQVARKKIHGQFNEMMPALTIFDTKWSGLSEKNKKSIWAYMKVLCVLCERIVTPSSAAAQ